jgi:adenine-specific DNA-methyltransferase
MSRLTDLVAQLDAPNPDLAQDLRREVSALSRRRPFGLNFERHIPETVELPSRQIRRGDKVVFRARPGEPDGALDRRVWIVVSFKGKGTNREANLVLPTDSDDPEMAVRQVSDLVVVAEFRDAIYPGLRSTGTVERGGAKPFHTVINGENYHVLEALSFVYPGTVDCVYIDPPYNGRDKDWKYNNDYVDPNDDYAHSKWLAFMERRFLLAKTLLNPASSSLIVTIDENEYMRLALLLEQTFSEATIQMVTSVVSAKGAVRPGRFSRVEEYIFFVTFGDAQMLPWTRNMLDSDDSANDEEADDDDAEEADDDDAEEADHADAGACAEDEANGRGPRVSSELTVGQSIEWLGLRRREPSSVRGSRPNQFFPVFVDKVTGTIKGIGDAIDNDVDRSTVPLPPGTVAVWPLNRNGQERIWGLTAKAARANWKEGFIRVNWKATRRTGTVYYLPGGTIARIRSGEIAITGRRPDGSVEGVYTPDTEITTPPKRVWHMRSHNAETGGTNVLSALIPERRFDYPKSLYAVEDTLRFAVGNKPDALILDFFAGSGTTAHAVMRLNKQNKGRRRSAMVTNNEVSAAEAARLRAEGLRPGDSDWEALGICEYITAPRLAAAVTGQTPDGAPIDGRYRFTDEFPMATGLEENLQFLTLTYEDPERVRYGLGFGAIALLLWLRAGSEGRCISGDARPFDVAETYAALFDVDASASFLEAVRSAGGIHQAYIFTDDETQFQVLAAELPPGIESIRLYTAYLENFKIAPSD